MIHTVILPKILKHLKQYIQTIAIISYRAIAYLYCTKLCKLYN